MPDRGHELRPTPFLRFRERLFELRAVFRIFHGEDSADDKLRKRSQFMPSASEIAFGLAGQAPVIAGFGAEFLLARANRFAGLAVCNGGKKSIVLPNLDCSGIE